MTTNCIASSSTGGTNEYNGACLASSSPLLSPLPPIVQADKKIYLEQRLGLPPLPQNPILMENNDIQRGRNGDSGTNEKIVKKLPKAWTKEKLDTIESNVNNPLPFTSDPDFECRLYMAPSSIPNSGLGVYSGVLIPPSTFVDINPQIILPLVDIEEHIGSSTYDDSVLANYPWLGYTQGVHLEAKESSFLFPNLGMLTNSNLGLFNVRLGFQRRPRYTRIADRANNPGTGGYMSIDSIAFETLQETSIQPGEEVFSDYGPNYFHHREAKWGLLFPTADDYKLADEMVEEELWDGDEDTLEETQSKWDDLLAQLERGEVDLKRDLDEKDEKKSQQRIAYALPKSVKDMERVLDLGGTARFAIPESKRSMEDLKQTGMCLDNLRKGKSNIPQAGFGAFATNNIQEGSIVAPAPLVPVHRELLDMNLDDDTETTQMLHNYCFGHPDSSLLFFPYTSSINFINHDNVNPNAYIRWSKSEMSRNEMLDWSADDVYTGLVLEVVALRDISFGEEVTIDYGINWTNEWYDHVSQWKGYDGLDRFNPQSIIERYMSTEESLKKPFRTMNEQKEHPYPSCVRTACYSKRRKGYWQYTKFEFEDMRFCDLKSRTFQNGMYWYSAKMVESDKDGDDEEEEVEDVENDEEGDRLMSLIPHQAIFLIHDSYCNDMHIPSIRHEIGVPEGFYPETWLDLQDEKDDLKNGDDEEQNLGAEKVMEDAEITNVSCATTAGDFTMQLRRNWSPNGFDRVIELVERGFFNRTHFFRVVPGFLVQFGMR